MLSNTAETKPKPKAVCHDAAGKCSTGIIDAIVTSESKKIVPFIAPGNSDQSGLRSGTASKIATHTATPITGNWSSTAGKYRFATTLASTAATRMKATMPTRVQSTLMPGGASFMIGQ